MSGGYLRFRSFDSPDNHKNIPPIWVGYFYVFVGHYRFYSVKSQGESTCIFISLCEK